MSSRDAFLSTEHVFQRAATQGPVFLLPTHGQRSNYSLPAPHRRSFLFLTGHTSVAVRLQVSILQALSLLPAYQTHSFPPMQAASSVRRLHRPHNISSRHRLRPHRSSRTPPRPHLPSRAPAT